MSGSGDRYMGTRSQETQAKCLFRGDMSSLQGFPGGSVGKEFACNSGDESLIPGSGSSPGGGNGNLLQYSCLGNPTDRGAWGATVHGGRKESDSNEATQHTQEACSLRNLLSNGSGRN